MALRAELEKQGAGLEIGTYGGTETCVAIDAPDNSW